MSIVEALIINRLLTALLAAGYAIKVNDGEDDVTNYLIDRVKIAEAMNTTDEDRLIVKLGGHKGFISLIYGNEADIISDYTINLEDVVGPVQAYSELYDGATIDFGKWVKFQAPRAVVHIKQNGDHDWFYQGDVELYVVDENAPHDRIYLMSTPDPAKVAELLK